MPISQVEGVSLNSVSPTQDSIGGMKLLSSKLPLEERLLGQVHICVWTLKQAMVELTLSYKIEDLRRIQTIPPPHSGKTSESPPGRIRFLLRQPVTALVEVAAPWEHFKCIICVTLERNKNASHPCWTNLLSVAAGCVVTAAGRILSPFPF